jgi:trk system potassium uptake protein TrkA
VIAGCGRVGREVALALSAAGDGVSVVDENEEAFELLGKSFDGTFHLGRAYDVDVLREAGAGEADVVLAVTDSDNANLMTVQVADRVFGVPESIALLADPAREEAYRALDVDFVAGARLVAQVLVERVHEPDFAFHLSFPTGEVQVVEMELGPEAEDLTVSRLEIEGQLRIAGIQRNGQVFIPADEDQLEPGDIVVASVRRGVAERIAKYLTEEKP